MSVRHVIAGVIAAAVLSSASAASVNAPVRPSAPTVTPAVLAGAAAQPRVGESTGVKRRSAKSNVAGVNTPVFIAIGVGVGALLALVVASGGSGASPD